MKNRIIETNKNINPYYIISPSYNKKSAGILVLHMLCHHLNLKGFPAYLVNQDNDKYFINPDLVTPILNDDILSSHKKLKRNPICIYHDSTKGNPINSKCVVRYLLNYSGLLGGDTKYDKNDLIFSYAKKIEEDLNKRNISQQNGNILFMPISNPKIFYPPQDSDVKRSGSCFYAHKYKNSHGGKLFDDTNNSVEIKNNTKDAQTKEEIATLLRKSEIFYAYEDTSLINEAILCGCPVVLLKNDFFTDEPLAIKELGLDAIALSNTPSEIARAKKTILTAQKKFFDNIEVFFIQLNDFIIKTQEHSFKKKVYDLQIKLSEHNKTEKQNKFHLGRSIKRVCSKTAELFR